MSDIKKTFPGETWDFVKPVAVGLDADKIDRAQQWFLDAVRDKKGGW